MAEYKRKPKHKRKKPSEIFGAVDPKLNVIDRSHRRRHYKPVSDDDWEKAKGDICPRCHQEALRFRPSYGVCINCGLELDEKDLRDRQKRAKLEKYIKEHNARIDKTKRRVR